MLLEKTLRLKPTPAAHYNLGNLLSRAGKLEEAEAHYAAALRLKQDFPDAWYNLGLLQSKEGKPDAAVSSLATALALQPGHIGARLSLGAVLGSQGKLDAALAEFMAAVSSAPGNPDAHFNAAAALSSLGEHGRAAGHFREVLRLRPGDREASVRLGQSLLALGQYRETSEIFEQMLRDAPNAQVHYLMAMATHAEGNLEAALPHYREAARLQPSMPVYLNDLAWVLATAPDPTLRNPAEAVRFAEETCRLAPDEPRFWGTLDAAYAAAGRFEAAISTAAKARDIAQAKGQTEVARQAEERLGLYRAGKAYTQ
jgi:tetratricopeptide (TPR) repeat protein